MKVRYDKLWRRMKDNEMKKSDLAKADVYKRQSKCSCTVKYHKKIMSN